MDNKIEKYVDIAKALVETMATTMKRPVKKLNNVK